MLRMVEEIAAEDDAKLQSGFATYDTCSGKSEHSKKKINISDQ